jgi:deoxyribonuclease IV
VKHALDESDRCPLRFENTAGAGDTLDRSFEELDRLVALCGRRKRFGLCLDSCHLFASGFDITTADKLADVIDRCVTIVGLERLRCLHLNDSQTAVGSNRDAMPRPAPAGSARVAAQRSCPSRASKLPVLFEGPAWRARRPRRRTSTG